MSKITLGKCLLSYIACAVIFSYFLQTSRGEFDSSEFEVRRRYQDFLWLKEKLGRSTPDSDYSTIARKVYSERNGVAL